MGAAALAGVAELVDQDVALQWHLTGNCFPPLDHPHHFEAAKKAIELCQCGDNDDAVEFIDPETNKLICLTVHDGGAITAGELVEVWHLESFLESDEEEG